MHLETVVPCCFESQLISCTLSRDAHRGKFVGSILEIVPGSGHERVLQEPDAVNAFQELKDSTHGRRRGLMNVVRQGLVRPHPLVAQSTLNHRIDEQNSCHHRQQPLNTEGFFRKP